MPRIALTDEALSSMRSRLCAAALEIIRDKGIEAVTFRGLAEVLGISHTLPYRYFDSKDALLAGVRVLCFERFEAFVREYDPTMAPVLDRVVAVIDGFVHFVDRYPVEYTLIFASQQPPPVRYPALLAARRSLFDHCVDLVQLCFDQGLVEGEPREITHSVWASVHGLLSLHVANQLVHGYALDALVRPTLFRLLGITPQEQAAIASRTAAGKKPVSKGRAIPKVIKASSKTSSASSSKARSPKKNL